MKYYLIALLSLFTAASGAQKTVPPVQIGGSLQLQYPPSVPATLTSRPATLPVAGVTNKQGPKLLSLVVDLSTSMHGSKLLRANESIIAVLSILECWNSSYPTELSDLHLQVIGFGSSGEVFELIPLERVTIARIPALIQRIQRYQERGTGTDYSAGLEQVIQNAAANFPFHQTIFLTDGQDGGRGPQAGRDYSALGDVHFVIFGNGSAGDWLNALPHATQINAGQDYELSTLFVQTLFSFVDDINRYLIRRGKRRVGAGQPFVLQKHATGTAQRLLITRPSSELQPAELRTAAGQEVPSSAYQFKLSSERFIELLLADSLAAGDYVLHFSQNTPAPVTSAYISLERCDLELRHRPRNQASDCYLENAEATLSLDFYDAATDQVVSYPDFLPFTSVRYQVEKTSIEACGAYAKTELAPRHVFATGTHGSYSLLTSWNYNTGKLCADLPPLQKVDNLCVKPDGRLIELSYDTTYTWEGRRLTLEAAVRNYDSRFAKHYPHLVLSDGTDTVHLSALPGAPGRYRGRTGPLRAGKYQFQWVPTSSVYQLAFAPGSQAQLTARKRLIRIAIDGAAIDTTALSDVRTWPLLLPFADEHERTWPVSISLNRQFPDERVSVNVRGVLPDYMLSDLPLTVAFDTFGVHTLPSTHRFTVLKAATDLHLTEVLRPEPSWTVSGELLIGKGTGEERLPLRETTVVVELLTDPNDYLKVKAKRALLFLSIALTIAALLLVLFSVWAYRRIRHRRKLSVWTDGIRGRSPEDFIYRFEPATLAVLDDGQSNPDERTRRRVLKEIAAEGAGGKRTERLVKRFKESALTELAEAVRRPHVAGVVRTLPLHDVQWSEFDFVSFGADPSIDQESLIRVRLPYESSYGRLRANREELYFENPTSVAYRLSSDGTPQRLAAGSRTALQQRETLFFGPDAAAPYFVAHLDHSSAELRVTLAAEAT